MNKKERDHLRFILSDFTYASVKTRKGLRDMERRAMNALLLVTTPAQFSKEHERFRKYQREVWPRSEI